MSDVFKALADETRRSILDSLFVRNGQSLAEIAANLPISRQAVSRHLDILETANLVSVHWRGREKLHYINPVPLAEMVHRWVGKFEDARLESLTDLKTRAEEKEKRRA